MGRNNLDKKVTVGELYERVIVPEDVFYIGVWDETGIDDRIKIIQQLKPRECVQVSRMNALQKDTTPFQKEILKYQQAGLDVGKGDTEFGDKMPLPEKGYAFRELLIFRRHEGK
jgi:hypothetical protein